jgi:hypothetical protein
MSSKRYKGKLCVYCAVRPSVTGDHVFAREFFTTSSRANLPQVPTCDFCNNEKSKLEHYLTTVLPFGGRHAEAHTNLRELVPTRLAKNLKLARELHATSGHTWHFEHNVARRAMTIALDPERTQQLFEFIGRGLAWHHWQVYLQRDQTSCALFPSPLGTAFFDRLFTMNAASRVHGNLGAGTVTYVGIQALDRRDLTIWRIKFYGGLTVAGDPAAPNVVANETIVITGPARTIQLIMQRRH